VDDPTYCRGLDGGGLYSNWYGEVA
jgi:hypothetical protein